MYKIRKQIQDILDDQYNTQEKIKISGEVFTSFNLIEKMLDKLPKQVWSDSNKTWLDPAAGLGNFHCVVVERLMVGLSEFEPNEEKRYKHILENQLYFIELNPRSAVWIRRLFNPGNTKTRKYKMNLVCADYLDGAHPGWDCRGYDWEKDDIFFPTHRFCRKKEAEEDKIINNALKRRAKWSRKADEQEKKIIEHHSNVSKNDPKKLQDILDKIEPEKSSIGEKNKSLKEENKRLKIEVKFLKKKLGDNISVNGVIDKFIK